MTYFGDKAKGYHIDGGSAGTGEDEEAELPTVPGLPDGLHGQDPVPNPAPGDTAPGHVVPQLPFPVLDPPDVEDPPDEEAPPTYVILPGGGVTSPEWLNNPLYNTTFSFPMPVFGGGGTLYFGLIPVDDLNSEDLILTGYNVPAEGQHTAEIVLDYIDDASVPVFDWVPNFPGEDGVFGHIPYFTREGIAVTIFPDDNSGWAAIDMTGRGLTEETFMPYVLNAPYPTGSKTNDSGRRSVLLTSEGYWDIATYNIF